MGAPDSFVPDTEPQKPIIRVTYWKIFTEFQRQPIHLSDSISNEDALIMADALSRNHNCIVILQKILAQGYGEEEVTWQRYLINGCDSFRNDPSRKTNPKKKAKVPKNGKNLRCAGQREEACPQPNCS